MLEMLLENFLNSVYVMMLKKNGGDGLLNTPLIAFRLQPLSIVAFLSVDVDITFHYITSQFSALTLALLGVARRCSQVSLLLAGLGVDSHRNARRWQPQQAAIHSRQA